MVGFCAPFSGHPSALLTVEDSFGSAEGLADGASARNLAEWFGKSMTGLSLQPASLPPVEGKPTAMSSLILAGTKPST